MPTNSGQVTSDRRHLATIDVTVPTKLAKSICILADDKIGRMSDGQHPLRGKLPAVACETETYGFTNAEKALFPMCNMMLASREPERCRT